MFGSRAVVAGASGLVGGHCLDLLLNGEDYSRVVVLVRKPLAVQHKKLEQYAVDFENPAEYARMVQAKAVFCCLGTTRKKAGSADAFRRVDFQCVKDLAAAASKNGVEKFLLVSSAGADFSSPFLYPRVKAEAEAAVSALPFKSVHILRPSFLLGQRAENRPAEKILVPIMKLLSPLMIGPARGYRPIEARRVARAMILLARRDLSGVHIHSSDQIQALSDEFGADDF